jgi:hypothetical protein
MRQSEIVPDEEHKEHEDFSWVAYVLANATSTVSGERLLPPTMDNGVPINHIFKFYKKATDCTSVSTIYGKLKKFTMLDGGLFGEKLDLDVRKLRLFLTRKMNEEHARVLTKKEMTVRRLLKYANKKESEDMFGERAKLLVEDALLDKAADEPTFDNICLAFDEVSKKPDGRSLWTLSADINSNLRTFSNNMTETMKRRYPKSKRAVDVLELAKVNGHLQRLAKYAANKVATVWSDEPGNMWDM